MSKAGFTSENIEKALTMFQGINDKDSTLAIKYVNPDSFVNHNHRAYEGVQGIQGFISHLPPQSSAKVVRAFEDGPYVFTHSEGDVFGGKIFFDIFRFEDGLIVEHWDNITDRASSNASGHTQIDGPLEATDRHDTEKNKTLLRDFYEKIFLEGKFESMPQFFDGDKFIRHDSRGGDGLSALGALMREQAQKGIVMQVSKIEMILGEGNFVLVAASGSIADGPVAYYDLFRVQDGKIAEHWNVIEEVPPADQWKNKNGKF
jgi:predicted SnoaL-like aldol condensation-catalyzing enzyme